MSSFILINTSTSSHWIFIQFRPFATILDILASLLIFNILKFWRIYLRININQKSLEHICFHISSVANHTKCNTSKIFVFKFADPSLHVYTSTLTVIIRFCISVSFFVMMIQGVEIFPTCLRQTGIALGVILGNAFGILGPYVVYLVSKIIYNSRLIKLMGL